MFDWCRVFSSLSPRRGRNFEHEWPNSKHNWCNWGWEAKGLGNGWPVTVETCRNMEKPWTRAAVEGDSQHPETGTTRTSLSMVENCWVKIFDFSHPKGKNYPQVQKKQVHVKHMWSISWVFCLVLTKKIHGASRTTTAKVRPIGSEAWVASLLYEMTRLLGNTGDINIQI